jgi:uncharacterized membrane protein (UPF0127 family)
MNRPSIRVWRPATFILIGGLVLLISTLVGVYIVPHFKATTEVLLGKSLYHLWVADTEAERVQGLSGIEKLQPAGGLLMKFDSDSTWGIWMKDMKIPLDIVWLNQDKKVIYMVENVDPSMSTSTIFMPTRPARYVVELPAGTVRKDGISIDSAAAFNGSISGASQL